MRLRHLLLTLPIVCGLAATVAAAPSAAPASPPPADRTLPAHPNLRSLEARARYGAELVAGSGHTPDVLGPALKNVKGPFRENLPGRDQSKDPTPAYSEAERQQLIREGKDLFFSTTAFGQRPSQGPRVAGLQLSCSTCHVAPGQVDSLTHVVGPVREREFGLRQTPALFGLAGTAPFGWDGRNPTLQDQSRGAIVSPLEMHASREPTKRELDALAEFVKTITAPPAVPGTDFDPVRARRGEALFRTPRPIVDPTGEFPSGQPVACATCHSGQFFTDGKAHRDFIPTGDPVFDPGRVDSDGTILGFDTPSLLGVRLTAPFFHDGIAGDPTAPTNALGGGTGVGVLDGDIGAAGPAAARRALLENVLPFYNTVRFNFGFTQEELRDLAEFVLSL
ncbi:MAG TPA: cytochrome c peroxidase [Acidimicrobiia bacterium]|nr:cytochrome c peroxidase [Acidimicrobiia bacterium]